MKPFTRPILVALTATSTLFVAACGHEPATTAPAEFEPLRGAVARVEQITDAKLIEVYGIVQPSRQSTVSSRVSGPIVSVSVRAGSTVAASEPMLEIQPEAIDGQVAQAEGALAQAAAALSLAERNYQRFENLHGEGAASDLELDMARMQLDQANGAVRQAQGAVQSARSVAGEAVVRAPFRARVVDTLVEVGDLAAPGRPLVRVESFDGRELLLTVRASDIQRATVGTSLMVRFDTRPDLGSVEGRIAEVVPSADPATHTFAVKVDLGNVDIASGLSGRASIPGDAVDRLVVPSSAIHVRGGLELVIVLAPDGTARSRAVTVGAALADGRVEILSGVDAGEMIVLDAPAPVADGTPVEVVS